MDNDATARYLKEVQYVAELENLRNEWPAQISADTRSISAYLKRAFWQFFRGLQGYLKELISGYRGFRRMSEFKNHKKGHKALVLGNGPSQGYLNKDHLLTFQAKGGEVFVVNYFNENSNFKGIIPNYLVISDPNTLSENKSMPLKTQVLNKHLYTFINDNQSIKIICPLKRLKEISHKFGVNRVLVFSDAELAGFTSNIDPRFPRGYLSMTLYKALAMALYFGYDEINILGIDNTYPRNIYSNSNNDILVHEIHAGQDDFAQNVSARYKTAGDYLISCAQLFKDLELFRDERVINLDPYSLTTTFRKKKCVESAINSLLS